MFTLEELLSKRNQRDALLHLQNKGESRGADGMQVSEFEEYWKLNGERIIQEIRTGSYEPAVIENFEVISGKGKVRTLSNLAVTDRFITRMLAQKFRRYLEPIFLENSYAYQEGKGILDAVMKAKQYMESEKLYLAEIDLKNYFDTIPLERLEALLDERFSDKAVVSLVRKYLYCKIEKDNYIENKTKGLVQGSSCSPVLSNLYLHPLDCWMEERGLSWIRFADNIYVFEPDIQTATETYNTLCRKITEEYAVEINSGKSGVYEAIDRRILGYEFYKRKGGIEVRKYKYKQVETHGKWHSCVVRKVNKEYHIVQDGILNKKDYSLLFENEEKKHHIPVEAVEQLNLYGEVTLTTGVFKTLAEKNIRCAVFDKYGMLEGYFIPKGYTNSACTFLKQCEIYQNGEKRLELAKQMELAGLHNMRANVRYYDKKKPQPELKGTESDLGGYMEQIRTARTVEELLLIEARARQKYYGFFNYVLKQEGFSFEKRTKQPPQDPLNALISFGNTLLYNRFLQGIWKTSLDPRVGIVHATNQRSFSLNLDFADIYKPIIVDRVIFSLINLYQIKPEEDFELRETGGVYLNKQGKRTFLEQFEQKLSDRIKVKGKEYTYGQLMDEEVRGFLRGVMGKEKYKPYKYY